MGNAGLGRVGVILMVILFINFVGIILTGIAIYSVGSKFDNGTTKIGEIDGDSGHRVNRLYTWGSAR